jgi:hypothetical protein
VENPISDHESEEETEQEDNVDIAVMQSSQTRSFPDEEDKENFSAHATQVPSTSARLIRVMNDLPSQFQNSPSLRRGRREDATDHATELYSSEPFAVEDSQSSQPRRRLLKQTLAPKLTPTDGGVDFVPQSPTEPLQSTETPIENHTVQAPDSRLDAPERLVATSSSSRQPLQSTIPETSSNGRQNVGAAQEAESEGRPYIVDSESRGDFETAQSRINSSTGAGGADQTVAIDSSSPPILATPPGRRRKRLAEIAAVPSPLKSQVSFNVDEALRLDDDFRNPATWTPGSNRLAFHEAHRENSQRRLSQDGHRVQEVQQTDTNGDVTPHAGPKSTGFENSKSIEDSEAAGHPAPSTWTHPRRHRKPSAKLLDASESRPEQLPLPSRA